MSDPIQDNIKAGNITGTLVSYAKDKPVADIIVHLKPEVLKALSAKVNMAEPVTPMPSAEQFAKKVQLSLAELNHEHKPEKAHEKTEGGFQGKPAALHGQVALQPFLKPDQLSR